MNEFQRATDQSGAGFASEMWHFLRQSKKWWLVPILVVFLTFSVLMLLSGTAAAPFIYTLF